MSNEKQLEALGLKSAETPAQKKAKEEREKRRAVIDVKINEGLSVLSMLREQVRILSLIPAEHRAEAFGRWEGKKEKQDYKTMEAERIAMRAFYAEIQQKYLQEQKDRERADAARRKQNAIESDKGLN